MLIKFRATPKLGVLAAGIATASILGATAAQAATVTASVKLDLTGVSTLRAISVGGPSGNILSVKKVSDPVVFARAIANANAAEVTQQINKPSATCSATDNPAEGYLNRTIIVKVAAGASANVYTSVTYKLTDTGGNAQSYTKELLGSNGLTVSATVLSPMTLAFPVCVA
jgi:hypothetical protein